MSELWVPLDVEDCSPSPFVQFARWFDEAKGEMAERDAIALATVSSTGEPSLRMVLMRHVDDHSYGWYTNYESRKGRELIENPRAAILWYCEPRGRQVRVEGVVEKMTEAESDAYFATRPRESQLGAHASRQSSTLSSREVLDEAICEFSTAFEGRDVPRPTNWGGFRLLPNRFEYWQHRENRLHDRVVYFPDADSWRLERQAP